MTSDSMQLFKQALLEATCNVYGRELAACGGKEVRCSRRHYARMRRILGVAVLPATTRVTKIKRRIVAALIAAILLLTGCATYAYREEIKKAIETIFDDRIVIKYDDNDNPAESTAITDYYTLGYVPQGYELVFESKQQTTGKFKWENSAGEYIILFQCNAENGLFGFDTETVDSSLIQIGEYEVYFRSTGVNYYVWNDGRYAYQLSVSTEFSEQEIVALIDGLAIAK